MSSLIYLFYFPSEVDTGIKPHFTDEETDSDLSHVSTSAGRGGGKAGCELRPVSLSDWLNAAVD